MKHGTSVLARPGPAMPTDEGDVSRHPLKEDGTSQRACLEAIYQFLDEKVPPRAEAVASRTQGRLEAQADLIQSPGVRTRLVHLPERWWRRPGQPMLGFSKKGDAWVALIPRGVRGYQAFDPLTGERWMVNRRNAASLWDEALSFSMRLPAERLKLPQLVKAGFRGQWQGLIWIGLASAGMSLLGLVIPVATGYLVDHLIPQGEQGMLAFLIALLVVAGLVRGILTIVRGDSLTGFQGRMTSRLQTAVWDRMLRLPVPFFQKFPSGDLLLRAMAVDRMASQISNTALAIAINALFCSFYLVLLFHYHVQLAWMAVGLTLLAAAPMLTSIVKVRMIRESYELEGKSSGFLQEMLSGMVKLKSTGAESAAFARWASIFLKKNHWDYRAGLMDAGVTVWNGAYPIVAMMTLFAVALAAKTGSGGLTIGHFAAFYATYNLFLDSALRFIGTMFSLLSLIPLYQRARPILDAVPEKAEAGEGLDQEISGRVEVDGVSYTYPDAKAPSLEDVSFSLSPGESLAIVGPSGSGKTTLLRVLLGFLKPDKGNVRYDGVALEQLDLDGLRRQFGVVLQGSNPLPGTIYEHLAGMVSVNQSELWRALRLADLEDTVTDLPMGIHTYIAEGGTTFSGGQAQRFMIAKALVRRPAVLFLDEATSALDNRAQARISKNLEALGMTRILVAHRLSTIRGVDRVLVLDAGRVVQAGSFQELLTQPGLFQQMASHQL